MADDPAACNTSIVLLSKGFLKDTLSFKTSSVGFSCFNQHLWFFLCSSNTRTGAFSSHHGGWTAHLKPPQTVFLWGRTAHNDHPPLLPSHQAHHGRTHAYQRGLLNYHSQISIPIRYSLLIFLRKCGAVLVQRQRLIRSSRNQRDAEAGPGSRRASTSNSVKRTGSCSLENGGGRHRIGEAESGGKQGAEVGQTEEEDGDDNDEIFSPWRIPGGERDLHFPLTKLVMEA